MNKYIITLFSIMITLTLIGCSKDSNKETDSLEKNDSEKVVKSKQEEKAKLPKDVFQSDENNQSLTKDDVKKSIQKYLNTNESVYNVTSKIEEKVWDEQNLTNEETQQLEDARKLLDENDQNFSNYLKNNELPSEYKKDTYRISEYFTAYNDTLSKLDNSIQQLEKKANDGEIPFKEVKDIIPDSNKVNGKQQEKIEKFLKSIDIKTKAFER